MKSLGNKFRQLLHTGPPAPPSEGPEGGIEVNHSRFDRRGRQSRQRVGDLRPFLPPAIVAALEKVDESTSQQILNFLIAERPDLARLLDEELKGSRRRGPEDLRGAVGRIGLRKASEGLDGRRSMSLMAAAGELVVALPVPPHLEDWVFEQVDQGMVFAAEDHLPPHLEETDVPFLDDLLPQEIQETLANVKGILAEGQIRGGTVTTRRSVVRVLQMLPSSQMTLFLHHMPHRPPHAEFAQVDKAIQVVELQ